MKAVVFTEEPGMGRAFIKTFASADDAEDYADRHGVLVFDFDDMRCEVDRFRQWVKSAADELATASNKLRHAQRMLNDLTARMERTPDEGVTR